MESLLKLLKALHQWSPANLNTSIFKPFAHNDLATFIRTERIAWAIAVCNEIEAALDVGILLSYSRQPLRLDTFKELIILFTRFRLDISHFASKYGISIEATASQYSHSPDVQQSILKIHFKYVTLIAANLQFWRMFESDSRSLSASEHPLLASLNLTVASSNNVVESISLALLDSVCDTNSSILHQNSCQLLLFIWAQFLQSFSSLLPSSVKNASTYSNLLRVASSCTEISEHLVSLSRSVMKKSSGKFFHTPTDESLDSELDPNELIYSHIMQEILSLIIDRVTLLDGSLQDLGGVVTLTDMFYKGNAELCEKFWSMWSSDTSTSFPLCKLVKVLVTSTPHDPVYLLIVLNAVNH